MMTTTNLNLFQLNKRCHELLSELYDSETGEVNELVQKQLDDLYPNVEQKLISITHYLKKIEAEKRELDNFIEEVKKRKKSYEDEIEKWKSRIEESMKINGISEIRCPYFSMRIKKNRYSTDIYDIRQIPSEFLKVKTVVITDADKESIKKHVLETGEIIPGAHISQKEVLEISINKI